MIAKDFIVKESSNEFRVLFTCEVFETYKEAIAYAKANLKYLKEKGREAISYM